MMKIGKDWAKLLDEILKVIDKCNKEQLEIKMEIFRNEVRKEKRDKKNEEREKVRER